MGKTAFIASVAAVLVATVYLALRPSSKGAVRKGVTGSASAAIVESATGGSPAAAAPASDAAAAPGPTSASPSAADLDRREELDPRDLVLGAPDGEPIAIEVVDGSGAPIAGAEVIVLDRALYDRREYRDARKELEGADDRPVLRRFGIASFTGEDGRTVHRWSGERTDVFVLRSYDEMRSLMKRQEDGVLRLVCDEPAVVVRVVDGAGRPVAGIPVVPRDGPLRDEYWHGLQSRLISQAQGRTHTDAEGTCVPAFASVFAGGGAIWIRAQVLSDPPLEVAADAERPPGEAVTLTLPPMAQVRVELVDGSGLPIASDDHLVGLMTSVPAPSSNATPPVVVARAEKGVAHFEHVAVGLGELVVAVVDREEGVSTLSELSGPAAEGELVTIQVAVAPGRRVFAQLVDGSGAPLERESVQVEVSSPTGAKADRSARTDRTGRLEFVLESWGSLTDADWMGSTITVVDYGGGRTRRAELLLETVPAASDTDLGVLTLVDDPLIVAGVVRDRSGAAVERAQVSLVEQRPDSQRLVDGLRSRVDDNSLSEELHDSLARLRGDAPTRWRNTRRVAVTDREGRFAISGEFGSEQSYGLVVRVGGDELSMFPSLFGEVDPEDVTPFEVGWSDVVLYVERSGSVRARVVREGLDEPGVNLWLQLVRRDGDEIGSDEAGRRRNFDLRERDRRGYYRWNRVEPGLYDLVVECDMVAEPVLTLERLNVPIGGECLDPRLEAIDLTDLLRQIMITVEAYDGRPVATWNLGQFDGNGGYSRTSVSAGEPIDLEPGTALDGLIGARGHRIRSVSDVTEDLVVRLERGYSIDVRVDGLPEDVDPRTVELDLYLEDGAPDLPRGSERMARSWGVRSGTLLDADGRARIDVAVPGRYSARFRVAAGVDLVRLGDRAPSIEGPTVIEVRDVPTTQEFTIEAPDFQSDG